MPSSSRGHAGVCRVQLARLLLERGFERAEILPRVPLRFDSDRETVEARIDFVIRLERRPVLLVRYAPGSLVSRTRTTLGTFIVADTLHSFRKRLTLSGSPST